MRGVNFALCRDAMAPGAVAGGAVCGAFAVVAAIRAFQQGFAPSLFDWFWLVAGSIPMALSLALPIGVGVGVSTAVSRWVGEGAWDGLRAAGHGGRKLVPAVLLIGGIACLATLALTAWLEPTLRAELRGHWTRSVVPTLQPGRFVDLGDAVVWPAAVVHGQAQRVFYAAPGIYGMAQTLDVHQTPNGREVALSDGMLVDAAGRWQLKFDTWNRPLADVAAPRVELGERSTADLLRVAERTEADGRNASYERSVLYKRFLYPLTVLFIALAGLPIGAQSRSALWLGGLIVGHLLVVRVGDQLASAIGPWSAASAGTAFVALVTAGLWLRWRDA